MSVRYKDRTLHMLDSFSQKTRRNSGYHATVDTQLQETRGKLGNTWDANHMTNFLTKSNYSNFSPLAYSVHSDVKQPKLTHRYSQSEDYCFKTIKDDKNASKIGYTRVNPLVALPQANVHSCQVIINHLNRQSPPRYIQRKPAMVEEGKFLFQANSVKFRITNPITLQHQGEKSPSEFEKQRMKWLITRRHPHGMTGVDHPESPHKHFYTNPGLQTIRPREQPNSKNTHTIDRYWKSKGRVNQNYKQDYGYPKGKVIQIRRFRNVDTHGYNIVTNCGSQR